MWVGTFRTKREAVTAEARAKAGLSRQASPGDSAVTFGHAVESWKQSHFHTLRQSTRNDYSNSLHHLDECFGKKRLDAITRRDVTAFVAEFGKRHSPNMTHKTVQRLQQVLSYAVEQEWLLVSPALGVRKPRPVSLKEPRILNGEERERLLGCTPEYWQPCMMAFIYLGLRRMEVFGMAWRSLEGDESGGRYRVTDQLGMDGSLQPLKTGNGRRVLPVPAFVMTAFLAHKEVCPTTKAGLMFPTPAGFPIHPPNFYRRVFKPAAAAAGLEGLTPHSLRHGWASHLARVLSPYDLCRALGHHDPGFTYKRYCSEIPMDEDAVVARLVDIMGEPSLAKTAS